MERIIHPVRRLPGEITVPGDKSISHRALMLAAIARGESLVRGLAPGADVKSTASCLRALGTQIESRKTSRGTAVIRVQGHGLGGLQAPKEILNAGNSGTTMRLLTGLLAGQSFHSAITGDESLQKRPMGRIIEPLEQMGAKIKSQNGYAPLRIEGRKLTGIRYELPVASAQVKSCLLLAGLYAHGTTTVIESQGSRDHTERMLQLMGADFQANGQALAVRGGRELASCEFFIPGDLSSAAFFIAAATLIPGSELVIRNVGVNPTRAGFLECLQAMGGYVERLHVREESGEPVADLLIRSAPALQAAEIAGRLIPRLIDEIPLLAVLATQAEGTTIIRDAHELRVKETDRLRAVAENLRRMGAQLEEQADGLVIAGPQALTGAQIESYRDHRIAMAFSVAGLIAEGVTTIEGAEWVDISFPGFFELLEGIAHG